MNPTIDSTPAVTPCRCADSDTDPHSASVHTNCGLIETPCGVCNNCASMRKIAARMISSPVLGEIDVERLRQDTKWGEQNHPDGTGEDWPHMVIPAYGWNVDSTVAQHAARLARLNCQRHAKTGNVTWLHIGLEEVAEAFAETAPEKLRAELIQVAAVMVAWIEAIDRRATA